MGKRTNQFTSAKKTRVKKNQEDCTEKRGEEQIPEVIKQRLDTNRVEKGDRLKNVSIPGTTPMTGEPTPMVEGKKGSYGAVSLGVQHGLEKPYLQA